ncbi:MAG: response regulator [Acidobacteria bacterium]|nr:response regulator [Acidobacteriota bacterium]
MAFDVMIVDDSPAMRRFIRRVIEVSGFGVGRYLEAGNGEEALKQLEHEWVDIVLTDINMPRMDGEELVTEMRKQDHLMAIPVIVISTDATEARIGRLKQLGAQGYVTKPFAPERLREEIETVLGVTPEGALVGAGMGMDGGDDEFSF